MVVHFAQRQESGLDLQRDPSQKKGYPSREPLGWVAVKELKLSYHNSNTTLLTFYPYSGKLSYLAATK